MWLNSMAGLFFGMMVDATHGGGNQSIREGALIVALGLVLILTAVAMAMKPLLAGMGKRLRIADRTHFKKS